MFERKVRIITDFLGSYQKSKDEFLFFCPKCKHHNPKLSVNFDKDVFKCWVCDYNGRSISMAWYNFYGEARTSFTMEYHLWHCRFFRDSTNQKKN